MEVSIFDIVVGDVIPLKIGDQVDFITYFFIFVSVLPLYAYMAWIMFRFLLMEC